MFTYPKKYKRFWVALPRQARRGPRAPIGTNEGLGAISSPRARRKALRRQRRAPGGDRGETLTAPGRYTRRWIRTIATMMRAERTSAAIGTGPCLRAGTE